MTHPPGASGGAHPLVPVSALLGGALALAFGAAWLLADPGALAGYLGSPRAVALTHLFTLLHVTLVYAGTLQQLPAVLLVADLAWKRLGYVALPLLVAGGALLVHGFASGFRAVPLALGGAAATAALALVAAQTVRTAVARPPRDPASRGLVAAACYLALTMALGTLLAGARGSPAVARALGYAPELHQTAGLVGAFLLGIAAAGHKLLAMFALAKGGSAWRVTALTWLVHGSFAATLAGAASWLLGGPTGAERSAGTVATLCVCAAGALQVVEVAALLRRRLRRRLEAPVARYVLAHAFLPLAGLLLAAGLREAAVVAALLGFVGLAVSGMLVKILSFLAWTTAFGGGAGRSGPAPLLRDLTRPWLEPAITAGLGLGALAATAAVAAQAASSPASAALFATLAAASLCVGAGAQLWQAATVAWRSLRAGAAPRREVVTTK